MADAVLTTGKTNFSGTITTMIVKQIADNLRDNLVWFNAVDPLISNLIKGTDQARFVAYGDLTVDDSAVVAEGSPNDTVDLAVGYQTMTVSQRMRTLSVTDVALDKSPHDLIAVAAERVSRNAAAVVDYVISKAAQDSTLSSLFANAVTSRAGLDTGDAISANEVRRVVGILKSRNVMPFPDGFYRAIISPLAVVDFQKDTAVGGWLEASKYAAPGQLLNGEMGRVAGCRFVESNLGTQPDSTGGVSDGKVIYRTYFFGPEWLAFGDLQTLRSYMVMPGGDHDDPAAQSLLVSWKGMYGAEILGDDTEASYKSAGAGPKFIAFEHVGRINYDTVNA